MAVAQILSKGLKAFEEAPPQVQKQIEEGDEQGLAYMKGKAKQQEIDQLTATRKPLRALDEEEAQATKLNIPGHTEDAKGLAASARETIEAEHGIPGKDPYRQKKLGLKYRSVAPPDATDAYEEVGYTLPSKMLTPEARAARDHWDAGTTAHVRRDVKDGGLRVFEIQSDPQNKLKAANTKLSPYNIAWDKDVINRQFYDAANQNLDHVDFLISPTGSYMARSERVQKNYETQVAAKIEALAKKLKGPNGEKATVERVSSAVSLEDRVTAVKQKITQGDFDVDDLAIDLEAVLRVAPSEELDGLRKIAQKSHGVSLDSWLKSKQSDWLDDDALLDLAEDFFDSPDYPVLLAKYHPDYKQPRQGTFNTTLTEDQLEILRKDWLGSYSKPDQREVEDLLALTWEDLNTKERQELLDWGYVPVGKENPGDSYLRVNLPKVAGGAGLAAFTIPAFAEDQVEAKESPSTLYTKVMDLLEQGATPPQVQKQLAKKYGTKEIQEIMVNALHPKIDQLRDQGASDEQITQVLQKQGIIPMAGKADPSVLPEKLSQPEAQQEVPETPDNLVQREAPIDQLDVQASLPTIDIENDDPEELLRKMRTVTTSAERDFKELGGMLGANGWANEAGQMREQADTLIANELRQRGINVVSIDAYGDMTIIDPETNQEIEYTSPWYKDLWHGIEGAKFEIGGAIAGASAGARAGLAIGGGYGALGGGLLGGMGGASLGRGTDVINAAREMKYKLTLSELQNHMGDAASADGLAALGVAGLWQLGKGTVKGIANGYDRLLQGNRHGAYQALKDTTDMSDKQIVSMLDRWEKITGKKALSDTARETGQLSFREQETAIRVAGQTIEGLEGSVQQAIDLSKTGGAKLAQDIAGRAKDLNKMVDSVTNERLTSTVTDHLSSYVDATKSYYGDIKGLGIDLLKDTDYRYDFRKMLPFEESLGKSADKITNWSLRQDFNTYVQQIRRLGGKEAVQTIQQQADAFAKAKGLKNVQPKITPELIEQYNPNRSFEDLLELRRVVNELRADTRFKSFVNYEAMTKAINSVDGEIARASKQMPNGDYWLRSWKGANEEYFKMKNLSSNVLYKALTKPQINHDKAVKAFADSIAYEGPESFMQVMARLPDKTRRSVEGSVLKHYVGKNTIGLSDELSAVNFPKLAGELDKLGFTTPEVRDMKRVVKEMSEVFKNDEALAQVAWDSPAGKFKSNIATTVSGKVKMQLATYLFKIWQAIMPTRGSDRLALTLQMRKVLDNPLDSKSINTLLKQLPKDSQLDSLVKQRAIEFAKFGKPESYGKTQVWRVAAPGNYDKASDTAMGRGVLFYVDEKKAREIAKQTGAKVTSSDVTTRRLATKADVETILGRPVEPTELRSREVLDALREKDFAGFTVDDKVLMFK